MTTVAAIAGEQQLRPAAPQASPDHASAKLASVQAVGHGVEAHRPGESGER